MRKQFGREREKIARVSVKHATTKNIQWKKCYENLYDFNGNFCLLRDEKAQKKKLNNSLDNFAFSTAFVRRGTSKWVVLTE